MRADFLLRNAGQLATLQGPEGPRRGGDLGEIGLVEGGAVAAFEGKVVAAGPEAEVYSAVEAEAGALEVDAGGALVTPGFVDPHTHALFGRYRADEYAMRVAGRPYTEIAAAGGGIHASVRDFRDRDDADLLALTRPRLARMVMNGSTTIEMKSGYGLSLEEELRAMLLLERLDGESPATLVPTFLGAHEIPAEHRDKGRAAYLDEICQVWIPKAAAQGIARFVDVFCEPTVFTLEESERILAAARDAELGLKIHADEIAAGYGGAALAARMGAASADHLIVMADGDMAALSASDTVAVLLPATSLGLASTEFAPARKMVDEGVAVALATDFNPGSSACESMGFILSLASSALKLTPAEALCAATHNAAWACGEGDRAGSFMPGKRADLLVHDAADVRELPYHMGFPSVSRVFQHGEEVRYSPDELKDLQ